MLQRKQDDWEQGHDITAADIIRTATTKYNNLVARKLPNGKNAWSASQAKSDKLMALTTQLTQLKQQLEDKKSSGGESGRGRGSNYGNGKGRSMVEEWRMKHDGDTKTVDGVEYVWCKKHIREGVYDGLYMKADTHPMHEAWQERKDNWKRRDKRDKSPAKGAASVPSDSKSSTGNLQLQQKLKSVLGPSNYRRFCPNGSGRHSISVATMLLEVGTRLVALPISKMGGDTDVSTLVGENSLRRPVDNGNEVS